MSKIRVVFRSLLAGCMPRRQ